MNDQDSERAGLTSASQFADDAACLGRQNLIRAIGEIPAKPATALDEYASSGDAVHKALETGNPMELTPEQFETYELALANEKQLLSEWIEIAGTAGCGDPHIEERLWIHDDKLQPVASAKLDRFWIVANHALIEDFKSLFAPRLPLAEHSMQLKVQAVAVWMEYGIENIRVAYNAPNRFGWKLSFADFDLSRLTEFRRDILMIADKIKEPGAPRTPGEQCYYCPAKSNCPEAAAYALLPSVLTKANDILTLKGKELEAAIAERVEQLPLQDVAEIKRRGRVMNAIVDAAAARLRSQTEETLTALGFTLGKGRSCDELTTEQTRAAAEILVGAGVPEEAVWKLMSLDKTATVKFLRGFKGLSSDAKAAALYEELLGTLITRKSGEPILREL